MSWSDQQQAMLVAMGLQVMVRASVSPTPSGRVAPVPEAPAARVDPVAASDHAALARALLRAAGGRDVAGLVDDIARLRREPALKRALWPRLRTLRRSH